jgi:hypothetical protein
MTLTALETTILTALRNEAEGMNNNGWVSVYLDNARPDDVSAHQFAAILGNLKQKGLYRSQGDDFFGLVFIGEAA